MMYNSYGPGWGMGDYGLGAGAPSWIHVFGPWLLLVVVWSLFWKGLALWHAAGRGQAWWFVIMLVVNTAGILEIIYLFLIIKLKFEQLFSLHNHGHHS